jgi:hypothetical protein
MTRTLEIILAGSMGAVLGGLGMYASRKSGRRRPTRTRHEEFLSQDSGTSMPISSDLVTASGMLLMSALDDRRRNWSSANNHSATSVPALIVTIFTAFDAWLNEIIGSTSPPKVPRITISDLLDMPTVKKYGRVATIFFGKSVSITRDLKLAENLRHEIVHFLPYRYLISKETVPASLIELDKKGLFIDTGRAEADFHFVQKIGSYALAYWICETLFGAAMKLKSLHDPATMISVVSVADNFGFHRQFPPPDSLKDFDRKHGVVLTREP